MNGCKQVQGMLAASLYEALPPGEAKILDQHLSACAACRAELSALRQLTAALPSEDAVYQGDLLPALRERLRDAKRPRFRLAWLGGATAFAAFAIILGVAYFPPASQSPGGAEAGQQTPATVLSRVLDQAQAFEGEGNLAAARDTLQDALTSAPEDPRAGDALLTLARVQYALGHFGESLEAYEATRTEHPDAWRDSASDAKVRYDLLADTRDEGFKPLVDLERARRKGESAFGDLERMVAQRPESMVAREALAAMCASVQESDAGASTVARLESVRKRCTDPTALARVDLEMGHAYWRDLDDPQRARSHFAVAAEADNPVLARLATEALNALDAPQP